MCKAGCDATPVPLFSRGPSQRSGLCASDPDGGWYVREGDHRDCEDHKGRVAWALEATPLTTASATPGTLAAFPNLVVGFALGRPGTDPGGTAVRVLGGALARGWVPARGPKTGPATPRELPGLPARLNQVWHRSDPHAPTGERRAGA
jgi:hypothetical protein